MRNSMKQKIHYETYHKRNKHFDKYIGQSTEVIKNKYRTTLGNLVSKDTECNKINRAFLEGYWKKYDIPAY